MREKDDLGLKEALEKVRYRIAMRIPLIEPEEARIRIMTLHGAKGLEADVVIVAGVADQIIPGPAMSKDPNEVEADREEQRRLLYVAATRARRELVISWPKEIDYKDATKNNVRLDGGFRRQGERKLVKLGRTALLPDVGEAAKTGSRWLKEKLGG